MIDIAALLRDHLGPALLARRLVSAEERMEISDQPSEPSTRRRPPKRGSVEITSGAVTTRPVPQSEPGRPGSAAGRGAAEPAPPGQAPPSVVQLHIDRVVVTRAPTPAKPTPPARATPTTVDHDAYLARRRERR